MSAPRHAGEHGERQWLLQKVTEHHNDIIQIFRRLGQLDTGGGFGQRDTSAYNISQQFDAIVRLTAPCHSGTSAVTAIKQQYTSGSGYADNTQPDVLPIEVDGYFMSGYAFADDIVHARFLIESGIWIVRGDEGHHMVRGTLSGTLTNGGSQTVTLARGGTVTAYEVLGITTSIASGRKVWLTWNKDTSHWEVVSAQC